MGLCSDSTSYYRVFGPCLDFSLIPCEEINYFQFFSNYFQDRVGPSSNQDRVEVDLSYIKGLTQLDNTLFKLWTATAKFCANRK